MHTYISHEVNYATRPPIQLVIQVGEKGKKRLLISTKRGNYSAL